MYGRRRVCETALAFLTSRLLLSLQLDCICKHVRNRIHPCCLSTRHKCKATQGSLHPSRGALANICRYKHEPDVAADKSLTFLPTLASRFLRLKHPKRQSENGKAGGQVSSGDPAQWPLAVPSRWQTLQKGLNVHGFHVQRGPRSSVIKLLHI